MFISLVEGQDNGRAFDGAWNAAPVCIKLSKKPASETVAKSRRRRRAADQA
jgi:hypothetical protein